MKRRNSIPLVIIRILCCIIAFVLLLLLGVRLWFRLPVTDYYRNSESSFIIPGLSDGMTHQGLAYDEETDEFLITAYRTDGKSSELSIVDRKTGEEVKRLSLQNEDNTPFTSHVGGISLFNEYIYIADGKGVAIFSRDAVAKAENGESVAAIGTFSTETENDSLGVAFVHVDGNSLFVGEFYREQNYPTPPSHKIKTKAGNDNTALILEYSLDEKADFAIGTSPSVVRAYSVTGLVQGMCLDNEGRFYLSTSYGTAFSHIYVYDKPTDEGEITVLNDNVPLLSLDSASLIKDIKLPPMSEEIVIVDGKLYTMCESATDKYIFGKFTSAEYCYATDISKYVN